MLATPKTLAQFLIGTCTGAVGPSAKAIARTTSGGCRLTGAATFIDALAAILSDKALAERVSRIRLAINGGLIDVHYDEASFTTFLGRVVRLEGVYFEAVIFSKTLREVADLIKEISQ